MSNHGQVKGNARSIPGPMQGLPTNPSQRLVALFTPPTVRPQPSQACSQPSYGHPTAEYARHAGQKLSQSRVASRLGSVPPTVNPRLLQGWFKVGSRP